MVHADPKSPSGELRPLHVPLEFQRRVKRLAAAKEVSIQSLVVETLSRAFPELQHAPQKGESN